MTMLVLRQTRTHCVAFAWENSGSKKKPTVERVLIHKNRENHSPKPVWKRTNFDENVLENSSQEKLGVVVHAYDSSDSGG